MSASSLSRFGSAPPLMGGFISSADAHCRWLSQTAHANKMAIGLKNSGELLASWEGDATQWQTSLVAAFDFSVIESCVRPFFLLPSSFSQLPSLILLSTSIFILGLANNWTGPIRGMSHLRLDTQGWQTRDSSRVRKQNQEMPSKGGRCYIQRLQRSYPRHQEDHLGL